MNFYHSHKYLDLSKKLFQKILIQNCKKFPIKTVNKKNIKEAQHLSNIIKLVDQLLQLNKDKQNISLPNQLEIIENRIDYTEHKIDQIVYQLYDLNEDEIKIVEGELL